MNKILLMALVLGTLSTTNVLAATDMTTTILVQALTLLPLKLRLIKQKRTACNL